MSQPEASITRRRLFASAGAATAAVAVASLVPSTPEPAQVEPQPSPQEGQRKGYQLTEHVQRYYQTARV
ncbi:formate dehydrogenase [Caldimonas thermodepolymerans]|jgi:hypothetical protein|uniref:Formate dehydrogenase n=1 Tax=Caldimonas thermodepolymerans TaxID=215580 RepID=A0A2S5T9Y2_9BURK|nr:formate dehydrogenase [Caldimonas thermodepolymerans]PPE71667.1 formate dehydrogenase [Caldimonas thermodepolymerans]QPC30694.1 formate dehydrogenase [Caldimonas thermodepolymerans]RDI02694.1 secreted protein [Caldimonas thermodepolymerans]TCP08776.1 secreted protein [Caldimonas thermodepolymerans]UZG43430.1 formate dehydrogenase [Caldimonas thermodepolymerans]